MNDPHTDTLRTLAKVRNKCEHQACMTCPAEDPCSWYDLYANIKDMKSTYARRLRAKHMLACFWEADCHEFK